jgi:hypothetical protein
MRGPLAVARFTKSILDERLAGQLRQVEAEDPDLTAGMLSTPKLITYTEPKWPIGIEQQPAVIVSVRNAGSAVLQDASADFETYDVTYEVAAEVYLSHPVPSVADMARYSWTLAIRQVWLSARDLDGFSVLPGFTETYDTVVEDTQAAQWVSRALSVVQVVVTEKYATGRVTTPVEFVDVKAGYVGAMEELNVPIHPALDDSDPTPATIAP